MDSQMGAWSRIIHQQEPGEPTLAVRGALRPHKWQTGMGDPQKNMRQWMPCLKCWGVGWQQSGH